MTALRAPAVSENPVVTSHISSSDSFGSYENNTTFQDPQRKLKPVISRDDMVLS